MPVDEIRRRSRWMLRALEWDDPRARYPNIWHDGMPRNLLALDTVASRLRLGDLVAIYHPASQKHPQRAEKFLGLVRVAGLRRAHDPAFAWVDFDIAHRLASPLDLGEGPRRVFLCCDPGWPEHEVAMFRGVFDAAVAEAWTPAPEEREEGAGDATAGAPGLRPPRPRREAEPKEHPPAPAAADVAPSVRGRLFGGADYSSDLRDARGACWLALLELHEDRLRVVRLEPTGRNGIQASLRDADPAMQQAEAIGLSFPFGLPLEFAESLLGGPFPAEGWWALARRIDRMPLPDYLVALQEFAEAHGEVFRHADRITGSWSPLRRAQPDLGSMAYHGIRLLAEERSRYAIRPFESAQGRLLLEVSAEALARRLSGPGAGRPGGPAATVAALAALPEWPVVIDEPHLGRCLSQRAALDAVLAARGAAAAVLSGETARSVEDLAGEAADRVRREGWIYGLSAPAAAP